MFRFCSSVHVLQVGNAPSTNDVFITDATYVIDLYALRRMSIQVQRIPDSDMLAAQRI